jgi:hypothetical protein
MRSLIDRVAEIERHLGIKTQECAGYCDQPTTDPNGMCESCREIDRYEAARLRRMERGEGA